LLLSGLQGIGWGGLILKPIFDTSPFRHLKRIRMIGMPYIACKIRSQHYLNQKFTNEPNLKIDDGR
jgi:hypothetical protein